MKQLVKSKIASNKENSLGRQKVPSVNVALCVLVIIDPV